MTPSALVDAPSFMLPIEELRARRSVKWQKYGVNVLPAWIADMDFAVAEPIQEAIENTVRRQDYGYGVPLLQPVLEAAFAERMESRFGWRPANDHLVVVTDLVQGLAACLAAFSDPGDGVVINTPIYAPFLTTTLNARRRIVDCPLVFDGGRFVLGTAGIAKALDPSTRILLLCNPHNPSGRVLDRQELLELANLAIQHDLVIVADEIHADLAYDKRHIPFATLGPQIAERTITLTSATKSFNIPGLKTAVMHFGSPALLARYCKTFPERLLGQASTIGIEATIAAWRFGQPWLDAVLRHLKSNRDHLAKVLREELPGVRFAPPEATYLAWLECRRLRLPDSPASFLLREAKVALNDGAEFGSSYSSCVRLNFATSREILDQILGRIVGAVRRQI